MASGTGSQTALQAWQVALFAQIDAAANSLTMREFTTLATTVANRLDARAVAVLGEHLRRSPTERVNGEDGA